MQVFKNNKIKVLRVKNEDTGRSQIYISIERILDKIFQVYQ